MIHRQHLDIRAPTTLAATVSELFLAEYQHITCHSVNDKLSNTTTITTIQRPFVHNYPGGPVPEETFTHSHPSWSSDILYQLPPSTIHSILLVQLTCLTVLFHNLSPGPLWSSSWSWTIYFILDAFLHPIIIFLQHLPIPSQPVLL